MTASEHLQREARRQALEFATRSGMGARNQVEAAQIYERYLLGKGEPSNLVNHAERELNLINEDADTIEGLLAVVQAYATMGHSGGSASVAVEQLYALLQYKPLSPITNDPHEWEFRNADMWPPEGCWQNLRDSRAISHDQGKTYWLVTDDSLEDGSKHMYTSALSKMEPGV